MTLSGHYTLPVLANQAWEFNVAIPLLLWMQNCLAALNRLITS